MNRIVDVTYTTLWMVTWWASSRGQWSRCSRLPRSSLTNQYASNTVRVKHISLTVAHRGSTTCYLIDEPTDEVSDHLPIRSPGSLPPYRCSDASWWTRVVRRIHRAFLELDQPPRQAYFNENSTEQSTPPLAFVVPHSTHVVSQTPTFSTSTRIFGRVGSDFCEAEYLNTRPVVIGGG